MHSHLIQKSRAILYGEVGYLLNVLKVLECLVGAMMLRQS